MGIRLGFRLFGPFWMTIPLTRYAPPRRLTAEEIAEQAEYRGRARKHRWPALFYSVGLPVAFLTALVALTVAASIWPHPFGNL
jgi:hypothetical protein